jgi:enoyl-CoA hydratase/carnithine racemase
MHTQSTLSREDSTKTVSVDYFHSQRVACINFALNERNTFNPENIHLLTSVVDEVVSNNVTRCLIFNSTIPNYFSDGFSLHEMFGETVKQLKNGDTQTYDKIANSYQRLIECPIPTISFVDGICRGGGFEWALSSDFIIATPKSQFALHEIRLGIVPGLGGFGMIKSKGNLSLANYCLLTGNYLSNSQAVSAGLVDAQVDNFQEMLESFTFPISQRSRRSLIRTKSFINLQETKLAALHSCRTPFINSLIDKK